VVSWPARAGEAVVSWPARAGEAVVSWPARAGEAVVFGADDGAIYALDPASGDERWTYAADGAVEAPIVVEGDSVYVATRRGSLIRLSAEDGSQVWSAALGSPIRTMPAVGPDAVYAFLESGYLAAVRRDDGGRLWTTSQPEFSYAGWPLVVGDTILATADDGSIYRLGPDGEPRGRWTLAEASSPRDGQTFFKLGPTVGGGALWIVDNNSVVRRLGPGGLTGPAQLKLAWAINPIGTPPFQTEFLSVTPAEWRGRVVAADAGRNLYLVDPASGQAEAISTLGSESTIVVDPVVSGDTLLVSYGGGLSAVRLPDGRERWRFAGQGLGIRPPTVDGDTVIWLSQAPADASGRSTGKLHALDLASGEVRWEVPLEGLLSSGGAVVRDGMVYVSTPPAAFDLATGRRRWHAEPRGTAVGGPGLSEAGDLVYVGIVNPDDKSGAVLGLSTADGAERWRAELAGSVLSGLERAWVSGDTVVAPLMSGAVVGLDAASGAERWRHEPQSPRMGGITVHEGRAWLMLRNAHLLMLDAATGQTLAQFRDLTLNLGSVRAFGQRPAVIGNTLVAPISVLLTGLELPEEER
jgi:outer membrane protein assembly factor BamB